MHLIKVKVNWLKKEYRKIEILPHISAHVMRHTACTRMAENGMDIKVLQYVMGHANIKTTIDVYYHVTDIARVVNEIEKVDTKIKEETEIYVVQQAQRNSDKWRQFGVKSSKYGFQKVNESMQTLYLWG